MTTAKNWTIDDIEALTEDEARKMALETLPVKGHTVFLLDFPGYFGYSAVVFLNHRHIYYANDYELHHSYMESREALRTWYVETMNNKLFTEEELTGPVADYHDYTRKSYYLRNYYSMASENVSIFGDYTTEAKRAAGREKTKDMTYSPAALKYYADPAFASRLEGLFAILEENKDRASHSYEWLYQAFLHEMFNHEYGINWQGNYDVLSAVLGPIHYEENDDLSAYFDSLVISDTTRRAFLDARREYARTSKL